MTAPSINPGLSKAGTFNAAPLTLETPLSSLTSSQGRELGGLLTTNVPMEHGLKKQRGIVARLSMQFGMFVCLQQLLLVNPNFPVFFETILVNHLTTSPDPSPEELTSEEIRVVGEGFPSRC